MKLNKTAITASIALSFFLGVMFSEPIKDTRSYFHYETAKGFYEQPYNLKIKTRKNLEEKIEAYLYDKETNQYQKIGPNMYVGDSKHRMKSAGHIIIEMMEDELKFLSNFYSFIFDKN